MKTILLTGCAGFIGSNLLIKLLSEGYYVVGLDNLCETYNPSWKLENIALSKLNKRFSFIKGDILDSALLKMISSKFNVDIVVHAAAKTGVRSSIQNPSIYEEVNVRGTLNMLEYSRLNNIKKFIFISSSSVYGNYTEAPFKESSNVCNPISPYAASKIAGELFVYSYSHIYKLPSICLRLFTVYGPSGRPDMVPYLLTDAVVNNKPFTQFGNGKSARDYTYISDIIDGIISATNYNCKFDIINLGHSKPVQLKKLICLIEKVVGRPAMINRIHDQLGDVQLTHADISKAKILLNYSPRIELEDGLKLFVRWYFNKSQ